ncbi:MAG: hypothetical protein Q8Q31_02500 [Nanoarchaeota archaeon]|nr:hypothetical protein [Nanoarchaeota archaeon]
MGKNFLLVAEVKTISPFNFKSSKSWEELFEIANKEGDILSIHTNPKWGGSFELIREARKRTSKPILAKGIHSSDEDIKRALEAGANFVLVVGRIPLICLDKCWIEPLNLHELSQIPPTFKVVWNTRDLSTGKLKEESFQEARNIWKGWMCQASNLKTIKDIKEGVDAVLVGTHLEEFVESLKLINGQNNTKT